MLDVVISGGGPVGLFLACELKLAGADPVVLERLPGVNQADKAHGLTGQVVRLLDHRGLFERCSGSAVPSAAPEFFFGAMTLPCFIVDAFLPDDRRVARRGAHAHPAWCSRPDDIQAMYDNIPVAEKKLFWIDGTTRRWDGCTYFQKDPGQMLDWFDTYMK